VPKGLVIGARVTRPTAKLIAEVSGSDYTETYVSSIDPYDYIFRYGNSSELALPEFGALDIHCKRNGVVLINSARSIANVCNKGNARKEMISAGIRCPWLYEQYDNVEFPVIVRPVFHSKGRKFFVCKDMKELRPYMSTDFYISNLIDKQEEYRVLVFNNKVVEVSIKEKTRPDADELIRNHRKGWVFRWIPFDSARRDVVQSALSAVKLFSLTFGAVDLCVDKASAVWVFEVNSAPGLITRKVMKLVEKINALVA
jgi:glutathione synthase/RimK-type ligase-like ATP-grasp enzyme